jgi:hypothetical protein
MKRILGMVMVLGGLAIPAQAATFDCAGGDTQCLRNAIEAADANNEDDLIRLAAGLYLMNDPVSINNGTVVIQGSAVDQTRISRGVTRLPLFQVWSSASLTLENIHINAGRSLLTNNGGTLTLIRSTFSSMFRDPPNSGTGVLNINGTLTITDSSFLNIARGGAVVHRGGSLTISGSRFSGNRGTDGGVGGAITVQDGTADITTSTFDNNYAEFGGAIHVWREGPGNPVVTVTDSAFVGNNAAGTLGGGGGILNSGRLSITNSTFANNRVNQGEGIAIANFGHLTLTNATIADNTTEAESRNPAALFNWMQSTTILQNTILGRNDTMRAHDCTGSIQSMGNNIIGNITGCGIVLHPTDITGVPDLGSLVDDGIPGHAHIPLMPGSPAANGGNRAACMDHDQLGRQHSPTQCPIGAVMADDQQQAEAAGVTNEPIVIVYDNNTAPVRKLKIKKAKKQ